MELDVRQGNISIDGIRYSDGMKLTGSDNLPNIKIENQAGNQTVLCAKTDIDNLVKALHLAQKTWGA